MLLKQTATHLRRHFFFRRISEISSKKTSATQTFDRSWLTNWRQSNWIEWVLFSTLTYSFFARKNGKISEREYSLCKQFMTNILKFFILHFQSFLIIVEFRFLFLFLDCCHFETIDKKMQLKMMEQKRRPALFLKMFSIQRALYYTML